MKNLILVLLTLISINSVAQNSKNWQAIKVPMQQTDNLYFWSADSGFALDGKTNALFKTEDGGLTWNKIKQFNEPYNTLRGQSSNRIVFVTPKIIYYTYNCMSLDTAYCCGADGHWFHRSYDGGNSWDDSLIHTPGYSLWSDYLTGQYFKNKNIGIISHVEDYGGIYPGSSFYYTEDGGRTLNYIHPGVDTRDGDGYAFFMGEKIIIGGTYREYNTKSKILLFQNWDSLKAGIYTYKTYYYRYDAMKFDDNWMTRFNEDYSDDGCNTFKTQTTDFMKSYTIGPNPTFQHFNNEIIRVGGYKINNLPEFNENGSIFYNFFDLGKVYEDTSQFNFINMSFAAADSNTGYVGTDTSFILKTIDAGGSREFRTLLSTGIKNENTLVTNGIKLFPNPATNQLNVLNNQDKQEIKYGIYSMQGQCLLDGMLAPSQSTIDISRLASGMYIFKTNFGISKFTVTK